MPVAYRTPKPHPGLALSVGSGRHASCTSARVRDVVKAASSFDTPAT